MVHNKGIRREFQNLDVTVWEWVSNEKKTTGNYPLKKHIQSFALKLYKDAGHESFKASAGWYQRWRNRYSIKNDSSNCESPVGPKKRPSIHSQSTINDQNNFPAKLNGDEVTGSLNYKSRQNRKWCKYDRDFKSEVIDSFSTSNLTKTAAEFDVHPNTISVWLKDDKFHKRLTDVSQEKLNAKAKSNRESDIRQREKEFISWLEENEKKKKNVSKDEIAEKITSLYSSAWSQESHWFAKYCHRYEHRKQFSHVKIHYPAEFQKLLVDYASRTSQLKASSIFNVSRKQLFNWTKNKNDGKGDIYNKKKFDDELLQWYKFQELKPNGRMIREKAKNIFPSNSKTRFSYSWYYKWCAKHNIMVNQNFDDKIVEWILLVYDENRSISHNDLRRKALEIYQNEYAGSFKASAGWLFQFCRRYMDLIRRIPCLSTPLPSSYENEILGFREKVSRIISEKMILPESFGVMDEMPLRLKLSGSDDERSEPKPLLRSCGFNNTQGSIFFCCLANGTILPSVIMLKDKNLNTTSGEHHVLYRAGDVVDEQIILYWLDNIWFRRVRRPNLLLIDCFEPHYSEKIRNKFNSHGSFLEIIPGGCSSKLNPLSQIISSQFQDAVDALCKKWYHDNRLSLPMANTSLSSDEILNWVIKAFEFVNTKCTPSIIRNVFKEMSLSTK